VYKVLFWFLSFHSPMCFFLYQGRGECFGRITIEAMAFRLPVLVSPSPYIWVVMSIWPFLLYLHVFNYYYLCPIYSWSHFTYNNVLYLFIFNLFYVPVFLLFWFHNSYYHKPYPKKRQKKKGYFTFVLS
jgi:hypothetical protein